ncbi:MAG: glycoside hydrolase family 2 TIM barrel-domain containing protein, partial [Acidobacteriaceae bacterium]
HDWSIAGPFRENNPSGPHGAYLPGGIGWYRKKIRLPDAAKGKQISIEFDGVYMNSDVWLNGHHLGKRPYGYVSFNYDLSPYLYFGDKENILAVRVDNSAQPNSRWYSGSGIYRHVWLTSTDPLRIDHWGTFIRTLESSPLSADVAMVTRIRNDRSADIDARLVTIIRDSKGRDVSQTHETHVVPAKSTYTSTQRLKIANPQLWSPDTPILYTAVSQVMIGNQIIDEYKTPFGVRSFAFDANTGFSLNGESMKLKGVCIHHDLGALGAAFNDSAMERRLRLLKNMGCNAIRMSHNPPAPQLLDMCDSMGFLVIDEAFDEWRVGKRAIEYGYHLYFDQWAAKDLKSMIERDRNHPSIILWSIGNEIPDKGIPEGVETAKMLAAIVRQEDPSRPVTCAINAIEYANKSGFSDVFDVVGYNGGGGSSFDYDIDHKRYPARKIYGSEAPHTAQTRGVYVSDENYFSSYDSSFIRMNCEGAWKLIQDRPFVAGAFRWAGIDYLGEPTPHKNFHTPYRETAWPDRSGHLGVIDTCGFEKDIYYFYQSQWSSKPMLHILPHWNWAGMEGKPVFIWCYTNCESVELFLNDRSLGIQHPVSAAGYHLAWQVPYTPGVLRAVGRQGKTEICRQEVRTSGAPGKLLLSCESNKVVANGQDTVHVVVTIADKNGIPVPQANNLVQFEVQGEGKLVGVDNGNPSSHLSFKGRHMNAFQGLCLAILQTTGRAGQITLRATSPGLEPALMTVQSTELLG